MTELVVDKQMCRYCWDILETRLGIQKSEPQPKFDTSLECGIFVTWKIMKRGDWALRGCIGCLRPVKITDLDYYTNASAFEDHRFAPISAKEEKDLRVSVSLLYDWEDGASYRDWIVGKHGIIIEFAVNGRNYHATYLPEVAEEQHWSTDEAIESLMHKAGYYDEITQDVLDSIHLRRYKTTKDHMTYEEYCKIKFT